ncbi:MAG: thiamine phosphate synthase [Phycisphaerae bacterium]|nr:thiamine phosphate synthase [Phycisphaerae bacterium]
MNKQILRLIDANFNRAREGLRCMEDFARFLLNDAHLSSLVKQSRHDLSQIIAQLPQNELLAARDTPGDVGTTITTESEHKRSDPLAVLQAAVKRLPEALRCLEEYTKIDAPELSARLEALRYKAYHLEKQLIAKADRTNRFAHVRLYVLLTESLCKLPILTVAQQALAAGVGCIQLRQKDRSDAELLELARKIAQMCHEADALFVMNDRVDLAILANADAVHLGQDDLSPSQARTLLPPHLAIGLSSHNLPQVQAAITQDIGYLALGAIFPSPTKPDVPTAGIKFIQQVKKLTNTPIIAIGGITRQNASQAIAAGATGIAVCQAIIASDNPKKAAREIKDELVNME